MRLGGELCALGHFLEHRAHAYWRASGRMVLRIVIIIFVLSVTALIGCTAPASVHIVSIGGKRLTATSPLVVKVSPDECYFWLSDDDELCIAMRGASGSIFGKQHEREFILSMILDGPPAGRGRHFPLNRYSVRMKGRDGFVYTRAASLAGEAIVWDYDTGRLRGRFRTIAKHQTYSILTGWRGDARVVIVGEFSPRRDARAGKAILARTEEEGMERERSHIKPVPIQGPPRDNPPE